LIGKCENFTFVISTRSFENQTKKKNKKKKRRGRRKRSSPLMAFP